MALGFDLSQLRSASSPSLFQPIQLLLVVSYIIWSSLPLKKKNYSIVIFRRVLKYLGMVFTGQFSLHSFNKNQISQEGNWDKGQWGLNYFPRLILVIPCAQWSFDKIKYKTRKKKKEAFFFSRAREIS